jgi:hypothetical protein
MKAAGGGYLDVSTLVPFVEKTDILFTYVATVCVVSAAGFLNIVARSHL